MKFQIVKAKVTNLKWQKWPHSCISLALVRLPIESGTLWLLVESLFLQNVNRLNLRFLFVFLNLHNVISGWMSNFQICHNTLTAQVSKFTNTVPRTPPLPRRRRGAPLFRWHYFSRGDDCENKWIDLRFWMMMILIF